MVYSYSHSARTQARWPCVGFTPRSDNAHMCFRIRHGIESGVRVYTNIHSTQYGDIVQKEKTLWMGQRREKEKESVCCARFVCVWEKKCNKWGARDFHRDHDVGNEHDQFPSLCACEYHKNCMPSTWMSTRKGKKYQSQHRTWKHEEKNVFNQLKIKLKNRTLSDAKIK